MSKIVNHPDPSPKSVAHRAARVVFRHRAIGAMGVWQVRLLSLALVLIGLSKAIGWATGSNWWWGWIAGASTGALVLGVVDALRARLSDAQGAGVLDDRLGLKSQLRSAIELDADWETKEQTPGFVALALAQAQSAAGQVEVHRAMDPIDTKYWKQAGVLIVLAIVAGIWLPVRVESVSTPVRVVPEQAIAQIDSIRDSIVDEIEVEESPAVQEAIAELESLKEELAQGVDDPEQANARAAAKLEELAEALDEQAQQDQADANEFADRIAQAQNLEEQLGDDLLKDFAQAIKEQEYADAQKELDALREQLDQMSDAQREALAGQLEQLADAVDPDPLEADPMPEPAQDLADSLREEAKQIRESEPESESPPESAQQPENQSGQQSDPQSDPQSTESAQDQKEKEGQQGQQGQSDESGKEQSGQKQSSEHQPSDQPSEQPTKQQESTEEQGKQEDQSTPTQKQGEQQGQQEQQNQTQEGQRPEQDEQGKQENQPRQDQSSESNGEEQQEQQETQGQSKQQQQNQQGQRSLDETLRNLERRKERAQRTQEQADDIRQQARELIEQEPSQPQDQGEERQGGRALSEENQPEQPEQRRSPGDGSRMGENEPLMNDPNAVSDFVPVDASGPDQTENTNPVGKWYASDGAPLDPGRARQVAQRFKEASKQAQQAIEQHQVPRKYRRVVREAFKRIQERADAIESDGKIAPQGKDATPKSSSSSKAGADE